MQISSADLSSAKAAVLAHQKNLDSATADKLEGALAEYTTPDCAFHFVHPFNEVVGSESAASVFWRPVRQSFSPLQRRQDIFMAGHNAVNDDSSVWVVSMGHLLGLFDKPFLGMRPTRQGCMLRYAEFYCVSDGKITQITKFLDIMNLMAQVRAEVMPPSTAATMVTPGPHTHDGLLFSEQAAGEGQRTLDLYQRMINRLLSVDVHTTNTDLSLDWTPDMIWWGPGGIGAPYTQERYLEQHCVPFEEGLEWGDFFGHTTEIAEGNYGGFFGWPTFDVRSLGGYIGLAPKSDAKVGMRVVEEFDVEQLVSQIEQECVYPEGFLQGGRRGEKDPNIWGGESGEFAYCLSLVSRINSILTSPYFDCVFRSSDESLTKCIDDFVANDKKLLRICLSGVSYEFRAREIVANVIGRHLLGMARSSYFNTSPMVVLVDEAHNFLGREIGTEDVTVKLDAFELIAREGRKYGLNICLATQRPRDITDDVLSQIGTLIVHRLTNDRDRSVVERACGEIDRSASSFLPNLKPGEAAVIGVDFPIPLTIQITPPQKKPISDGPNFQRSWGS